MGEQIITPEQQRLIIEKLHRSDDSITALHRFNELHGETMGHKLGTENLELRHFGQLMDKALENTHHNDPHYFTKADVHGFTQEITGHDLKLHE